ncbi:putative ubiquitin thioesterase L96 [Tropilaelaps mercedesae]|uniref:Putative ubiquitin thioesterase L96 n=1 Tax=Tropilaelaps mercedesae TaxID=418985 RepID=A0A1V9X6F5_9ACAR|nr:putative ubiquitin thioesterase L96 [Tropilaelaps mercedesae]
MTLSRRTNKASEGPTGWLCVGLHHWLKCARVHLSFRSFLSRPILGQAATKRPPSGHRAAIVSRRLRKTRRVRCRNFKLRTNNAFCLTTRSTICLSMRCICTVIARYRPSLASRDLCFNNRNTLRVFVRPTASSTSPQRQPGRRCAPTSSYSVTPGRKQGRQRGRQQGRQQGRQRGRVHAIGDSAMMHFAVRASQADVVVVITNTFTEGRRNDAPQKGTNTEYAQRQSQRPNESNERVLPLFSAASTDVILGFLKEETKLHEKQVHPGRKDTKHVAEEGHIQDVSRPRHSVDARRYYMTLRLQGDNCLLVAEGQPSVRRSVSPSVHLSVRPSVGPSVRQSVRPSVRQSVSPSVRRSVSPSVHLSVRPSVGPSFRQSVRPSVRQSVGPSVRPSVRRSICPSVRPSVRRSIRQSVRRPVRLARAAVDAAADVVAVSPCSELGADAILPREVDCR